MRKIVLLGFLLLSTACSGQKKSISFCLQQIEFIDTKLTDTIFELSRSKPECFKDNEYFILNFFQSSLPTSEFFLSIKEFIPEDVLPESISYFVVINNITFFVSNRVSLEILRTLPQKKEFVFKLRETPYDIGGDLYFLIWRVIRGEYLLLLSICGGE
jgi:hypothetical protein